MDRLTSLRLFREIVESGSFAAAARRLAISAPMASKRLAELESSVNARLLHRTSRRLSLTEAGSTYYRQCCQAIDLLDAADAQISRSAEGVRGQLKLSAPVWCANAEFARALVEYRRRYPDVVVDIHLANHMVDLVSEGFDIALRATREPSPALISRPLCEIRFQLVASPEYLERARSAKAEVPVFDAVIPSYVDLDSMASRSGNGATRFRLNAAMRSNDTTLTYHAVRAGIGAAFLPEWLIADDLRNERLASVLPENMQPPSNTLFAIYTSRQYMAPKLRTFIDFMIEALAHSQGKDRDVNGPPSRLDSAYRHVD